jgi:DNA-binding MarR family transcriptional regulator
VNEPLLRDLVPAVIGVLVRRGADFASAEDAVQDALVEAVRVWPDDPPQDPKGWLVTVAGRKFLDATRADTSRRRREVRIEGGPMPGRRQARQSVGKAAMQALAQPIDLEHVAVVDAIEEGSEGPDQEVTVGDVAERLGIDPSRASRVVTAAIKSGYVRRLASQADGRRICLELTPDGHRIVDQAHRQRQTLYSNLMDDWSQHDRTEFARLLTRFAEALTKGKRG